MAKVAVIGAGNVGATCAHVLAQKDIASTVALVDIVEGMPQGKALDMRQAGPLQDYDSSVVGYNDVAEGVAGADVVVMTAGLARKPGMDRMDLLKKNLEIVAGAMKAVKAKAPGAVVVMVTNPLDVMTWVALKVTGFPRERVLGMAGVLDSTRLRTFIAMELGVSVVDVSAMVLGGHGDTMVPLPRYSTVNGVPITELLAADVIEKLSDRTRKGGGEIVALLKTGSAYYAPATSAVQMVEAVLKDRGHLLPACVALEGEYGEKGICLGVPVIIGARGLRRVVELRLTEAEKAMLKKSADSVRKGIDEVAGLIG
ncbi:MAG: malate dehydrogenase [Planctomycetaceae bacterium]|nr:malate dehydrogenase [Planctomycetota bacterium]NUN52346.1 malate dehydrogenase [Planctomycetaceae bacterium]